MKYADCDPEQVGLFSAVWAVLIRTNTEEGAGRWLNTPNVDLDGQTPIDVINEGDGYRVRNVAYRLEQ